MGCSNTRLPAAWRRTGAPVCSPTGRVAHKPQLGSAPICNGYSVTVWDEDIASANGYLSYHQTPASQPRGRAQGLRCVLQLDVSPTTRSAPICNGYSVKGWDEDIGSANGSLSYHQVVSGELWDAQTPASWPRGGAQGLWCVLQLDVSPTTWSAPICNGYTVKGWDEDIASANGSLSYHRVVSGEVRCGMLKHPPPGRVAACRGSGVFSNWTHPTAPLTSPRGRTVTHPEW